MDVRAELVALLRRQGLLGADLLVGLSGGLDSVCLLRLLGEMREQHGGRLEVAHVDHALRPDSAADAAFCRALAAELACPFHLRRLGPGVWTQGGGVQALARRERQRFFEGILHRRGLTAVALGHHADDQAETVLYRLLRGTGLRGAGAMSEFAPPYLRPLLPLGRALLHSLAAAHGWGYREDPTNGGDGYARNRLRHRVMPLLEQVHPGAAAGLVRFARLAAADDQVLTRLAHAALLELAVAEPEGVRLPVTGLAALEAPLRRRVYLALWHGCGWPTAVLQSQHLEAVDALLHPGRAHRFAPVPGPGRFAVSYDHLWLLWPESPTGAAVAFAWPGPGRTAVATPWGMLHGGPVLLSGRGGVGLPRVAPGGVWVRSRRPGDRLERPGHRPRKLKDLLIAARVPLWRRPGVLVVGVGDRVFGALGTGFVCGGAESPGGWLWLVPDPGGEVGTGHWVGPVDSRNSPKV